ncbi:MAG: hypothetical protein Q4D06_09845 [Coriobacteriia bacterium]|nr:hypothetical protein [Coriobacteriia bacterium]
MKIPTPNPSTIRLARFVPAVLLAASLGAATLGLSACSSEQPASQGGNAPAQQQSTQQPADPKPADPVLEELTPATDHEFDVTGDGTANKLRLETADAKDGTLASVTVLVDGKEALSLTKEVDGCYSATGKFLKTANGLSFVELLCTSDNDYPVVNGLYVYRDGAFKPALDYINFVDDDYGTHRGGAAVDVKDDVISVRYGLMSYILGYGLGFTFDYQVGPDGTLTRTSDQTDRIEYLANGKENTAESNQYFTQNYDIEGYANPDDDSKATLLKKGTLLTPKAVAVVDDAGDGGDLFVQFQEKKSGEKYWIEADVEPNYETTSDKPLLDGVMYAG